MDLKTKVKMYGNLHNKIKNLRAELKQLSLDKEQLEAEIRHELDKQGFDKLAVDGVTVYPRDDMYISLPKGNPDSLEWLMKHDMDEYLNLYVSSQTLTAIIKEYAEQHPDVDWDEIKSLFNVTEKKRVGVRLK